MAKAKQHVNNCEYILCTCGPDNRSSLQFLSFMTMDPSRSTADTGHKDLDSALDFPGDFDIPRPRKRHLSVASDSSEALVPMARYGGLSSQDHLYKRQRVSSFIDSLSTAPPSPSTLTSTSVSSILPRPLRRQSSSFSMSGYFTPPEDHLRAGRSTNLKRKDSMYKHSSSSRPPSPVPSDCPTVALMRSISSAPLTPPVPPTLPEWSAKHHMKQTKMTWDFSYSPATPSPPTTSSPTHQENRVVMSISKDNIVFFTRGDRVHYKNIASGSEEVGQLLRLSDGDGYIRVLKCSPPPPSLVSSYSTTSDAPSGDFLAVGTSTGLVQLWDVRTRKKVLTWGNKKSVNAMAWNQEGYILTIGGSKGTIRHYDTRVGLSKSVGTSGAAGGCKAMKESARKVTRHQGCITALEWNIDGRIWASGDDLGVVYTWDARNEKAVSPMDVGEFVQRRKKIGHDGPVSALAFCPWEPRVLATGDTKGTVKFWNVNPSNTQTNALSPDKLELGGPIMNLHWSPHYKEILATLGGTTGLTYIGRNSFPGPPEPNRPPSATDISMNTLQVYSFPTLRHVYNLTAISFLYPSSVCNPNVNPDVPDDKEYTVYGSVINSTGTKVVVAAVNRPKSSTPPAPTDNTGTAAQIQRPRRRLSFLGTPTRPRTSEIGTTTRASTPTPTPTRMPIPNRTATPVTPRGGALAATGAAAGTEGNPGGEGKMGIVDVWPPKKKELKRVSSFMGCTIR
ncbi:hypothetical protein H0H93_015439 [Arthromyces matolae]|nr:hypothetical protein H0H93_015439 [Arthromyces matolae]